MEAHGRKLLGLNLSSRPPNRTAARYRRRRGVTKHPKLLRVQPRLTWNFNERQQLGLIAASLAERGDEVERGSGAAARLLDRVLRTAKTSIVHPTEACPEELVLPLEWI